MGAVGSIPTVAIYAAAHELGEDPQEFLALCRQLDAVYMSRVNPQKETNPSRKKSTRKKK